MPANSRWDLIQRLKGCQPVGPFYHGMGRSLVAVRGDSLQIWRVAVTSIMNKQSRTDNKRWSSSFGIKQWGKHPSP